MKPAAVSFWNRVKMIAIDRKKLIGLLEALSFSGVFDALLREGEKTVSPRRSKESENKLSPHFIRYRESGK